ncbi:MAG: bifunctional nicotinamidase/pyrazinamidase [Chitinivibrionales bacterium]|nr:bifunctional nicotinamidase/pyrazinamidase [Chitinivibrionales bacterium]MBD3358734.1 bifunctional nicotinamidase/pyrazinamidase [Chitinivibrionales bacterium]
MAHKKIEVTRDTSALILVDIQPDFLPGGPLGVAEGDHILPGVDRAMKSGRFATVVATQDWHPPNHISFASRHEGHKPLQTIELYGYEQTLWPDHCVVGTKGAELHPSLPWEYVDAFMRKGTAFHVDSYSGFRNNWGPGNRRPKTGLAGYLRDRGVTTVYVCGLARDVCVRWTVQDAVAEGFRTTILWDLCRPVDPSSDDRLRADFEERGIRIALEEQFNW